VVSFLEYHTIDSIMKTTLYTAFNSVEVMQSGYKSNFFYILWNELKTDQREEEKDTGFLFKLQKLLSTMNINLRWGICFKILFSYSEHVHISVS
jgi:hypothetical protein